MGRTTLADLATMTDEELVRTLGLTRASRPDPNETIEPNRSADAGGLRALRELAEASAGRTLTQGLELGPLLGEGGMGVVRLAVQRSLGRPVAVKTLQPSLTSEAAVLRLVREAWVTGSLEHPNIVPVYDLALDERGAPTIVLRRIEGETWDRLMHAPEEIERRFGATDPLEWNLGILLRVANAVALAHSRGVVHRDLKPENVMIGAFGEVYVLDWGVAVSLQDDREGRLPVTSSDVAGTPAYMAPEMFGILDEPVSERSDVYLMGGILHQILTGRPPHNGETVRAMLVSAATSKFTYPPDVPRALTDVADRALAAHPADRFESVAALQKRVEWFLRHRGSLALSLEADARARELTEAAAAGDGERVHRCFAECRFGYRAALRASPDNADAAAGLQRAAEAVVRFELARNAPESAAAALAEMPEPPAELAKQVAEANQAAARERERFLRLQEEQNRSIGRRTRRFVGIILGVVWSLAPLVGRSLELRYAEPAERGHTLLIAWSIVVGTLSCGIAYWARDSLSRTVLNRRVAASVVVVFATQLALQLGARLLGMPVSTTIVLFLFAWFAIAATISVVLERRLFVAAIGYLCAFIVAAAYPPARWGAACVANFVLGVTLAFAWRPEEIDAPPDIRFGRRRGDR